MSYLRRFDPKARGAERYGGGSPGGDRDAEYVYTEPQVLAINVALATGRPLLVQGPPGCGKSTLARDVARQLDLRYYAYVVSSRTEVRDLLFHFDAVRRLSDAQVHELKERIESYFEPRALWWAFDPDQARRRGLPAGSEPDGALACDPGEPQPRGPGAVVLIDEIDKAEADLPNDLLVPLGALQFSIDDAGAAVHVKAQTAPFVVITSNDERELPGAFLRRCVVLRLDRPSSEHLRAIARAHFPAGEDHKVTDDLIDGVAARFAEIVRRAESDAVRAPGTAEFLDALRACASLGVDMSSSCWTAVTEATLWKHVRALEIKT